MKFRQKLTIVTTKVIGRLLYSFRGSVVTKTVLGGLIVYPPNANSASRIRTTDNMPPGKMPVRLNVTFRGPIFNEDWTGHNVTMNTCMVNKDK